MDSADSFEVRMLDAMKEKEGGGLPHRTAAELYSPRERFREKNWQTLGMCLTAQDDFCEINSWRHWKTSRDEVRSVRSAECPRPVIFLFCLPST
jgi:hypothetical protein